MELTHNDINNIAELVAEKIQCNLVSTTLGRWLTLDEAMAYAKVKSKNTIKNWLEQGYIKGQKRTGAWIIDRQSIDA